MRLLCFLLLTILTLVACKPKGDYSDPARSVAAAPPSVDTKAPSIQVPRYWNLNNVEVLCGTKRCPPQVGILFFFDNGTLDRCTATLIQKDQVLTTGHCDGEIKNGYFILGSGKQRHVRRLQDRLFKVFTPNPVPENETHAPAGLVFSLDNPIDGIPDIRLASGPQDIFTSLTAYVVNLAEPGDEKYRVDASECVVRRHEAFFPYDLSETPDLIWAFDCKIQGGNSGAPLFAAGSGDIQAVLQAVTSPEKYAENVRKDLHREPNIYEKHWLVMSTNVRCLSLPGTRPQACTKFDDVDRKNRFILAQNVADTKVMQHQVPRKFAQKFDYQSYSYTIVGNQGTDQSFEMFYLPKCHKGITKLKEVEFPSELIRYSFDEWATPVVESKGVRISRAAVLESKDALVSVDTEWAEPFAPLQLDVEHPRRKWGKRFSIEIPQCAR